MGREPTLCAEIKKEDSQRFELAVFFWGKMDNLAKVLTFILIGPNCSLFSNVPTKPDFPNPIKILGIDNQSIKD